MTQVWDRRLALAQFPYNGEFHVTLFFLKVKIDICTIQTVSVNV